tara:strand:- start:56 stop:439 length:384 start_codon:yes stop_codon:yes gene_type:complete
MKLSKNFNKREFNSKDGKRMPLHVLKNIKILAVQVQIIRDALAAPIHINSGYRSPEHNKRIGGVKNSQHVQGKAADLASRDCTSLNLYNLILQLINEGKIINGGLGIYNGFVHYDIRSTSARWDYRK